MIFSRLLLFLLFTALIAICFADEQDTGETGVGDATTGNDNANETTAGYNAGDADDAGNTTATNTTVPASQSPAANSTQGTSNETTSEFDSHLSSLYINTVKPGRGSPIITPVFKENSLVSSFNSCRLADDDSFRLDESADCFEDDAFNDRLAFQITYHISGSVVQKAFEDHRPNLSLLGDSRNVAESTISGYSVDIPNSNAKVSISYGCKQDSDAEISLRLRLQFGDDDDSIIDIFWKKMCKSGLNDEIEFGYVVQDKDSGEEEHHEFGTDSDAPYIVSPGDVSTEIYLKVNTPGAQQEFLSPFVRAKNPQVVTVSVRGNHPKGGTLQGLLSTSFQVSYECLTKGSSDILVDVAIPPFQNLSTTYRKDCGGSTAKRLRIGSTEGGFDIVDEGKPTPKYMLGIEHIGTEHSDAHLHLPGNQSDWVIFLSNGDKNQEGAVARDSAIQMGRIGVTVEKPEIVYAVSPKLSSHGPVGWREISNVDNNVYAGEVYRISFHFVCRQIGESRLLVTIPLRDYDTLEFGVAKQCDHVGTAYKSKEWVLTVGNVFWGAILILIGGAAVYCLRRRGKDTAGFARVPVTEQ